MARTEDHGWSDRRDGPATRAAACGYWQRRGLPTEPRQVAVAPGAPLLLLALLGTHGGGVLLPRPGVRWHAAQARTLGRPVHTVPVPAECGGVPDPVALLETVQRARADGDQPRVLVLSVADDCTGTAAPPELLREVCEAAAVEGLLVVSDETWRDTLHDPRDTVTVSPAEMLCGGGGASGDAGGGDGTVVVLAGVGGTLPPPVPQAGVARFPDTERGRAAGESARAVLAALGAGLSRAADAGAAEALGEAEPLRARRTAAARAYGVLATAVYRAVTDAGALCRPPSAGRHLYADFEPVRGPLAASGVRDAASLEAELVRRIGPYADGGHRFGDDPRALRVRLSSEPLTGRGSGPELPGVVGVPSLAPPDPLESPDATRALHRVRSELAALTATGRDGEAGQGPEQGREREQGRRQDTAGPGLPGRQPAG